MNAERRSFAAGSFSSGPMPARYARHGPDASRAHPHQSSPPSQWPPAPHRKAAGAGPGGRQGADVTAPDPTRRARVRGVRSAPRDSLPLTPSFGLWRASHTLPMFKSWESNPCEKCRFNRHNSRVDWENNGQGTSPASPASNPHWEANGLSCSRRSRPGSSGPLSCSILTCPRHRLVGPHLRRRHDRSRSS